MNTSKDPSEPSLTKQFVRLLCNYFRQSRKAGKLVVDIHDSLAKLVKCFVQEVIDQTASITTELIKNFKLIVRLVGHCFCRSYNYDPVALQPAISNILELFQEIEDILKKPMHERTNRHNQRLRDLLDGELMAAIDAAVNIASQNRRNAQNQTMQLSPAKVAAGVGFGAAAFFVLPAALAVGGIFTAVSGVAMLQSQRLRRVLAQVEETERLVKELRLRGNELLQEIQLQLPPGGQDEHQFDVCGGTLGGNDDTDTDHDVVVDDVDDNDDDDHHQYDVIAPS
eukprot:TRINITY_DN800_c0_g2_i8.p1 TRINITY_DN800_c0_g2~~TRINITY_DN800_c0_g2_i8.p1  ORF type:complete len:282 (+),score=65.45 TRINITY_DN800_c0_g2_i8:53-898(+)